MDWKDNLKAFKSTGTDDGIQVASGRLHAGFLSRADEFPVDKVLSDGDYKEHDVVFCGHSLGGAVAMIAALRATVRLEQLKAATEGGKIELDRRITCITFGAPLVGDADFRDFCERNGIAESLFNFVNEKESYNCVDVGQLKNNYREHNALNFLRQWIDYIPMLISQHLTYIRT